MCSLRREPSCLKRTATAWCVARRVQAEKLRSVPVCTLRRLAVRPLVRLPPRLASLHRFPHSSDCAGNSRISCVMLATQVALELTNAGVGCPITLSVAFDGGGCDEDPIVVLDIGGDDQGIQSWRLSSVGEGCTAIPTVAFTGADDCAESPPEACGRAQREGAHRTSGRRAIAFGSHAPDHRQATAIMSGSFLQSVTVVDGGRGCTEPPQIVFEGGGCTALPAASVAVLSAGGAVESVTIDDAGSGCAAAALNVSFTWGGCTMVPSATADVVGGEVSGLVFSHRGVRCTPQPSLTIESTAGDSGGGAAATLVLGSTQEQPVDCVQRCAPPVPPANAQVANTACVCACVDSD